jgi:transposase
MSEPSQRRLRRSRVDDDMCKSFDGLVELFRTKLVDGLLSGQLFVIINRCRTQLKVSYFDRGGYCV